MISKKLSLIVVIIFFTFLLFSCRTKEKLIKSIAVGEINETNILDNIIAEKFDFNTLFFRRVNVEVSENGNINSFRANIYIENGKQIIISIIPLLGIELARVLITPEQIIIIDRFNKEVYYTNFNFVERKFYFNLNYNLLQSILTNRLFCYPDENPVSIRNYTMQYVNGVYLFKNDNGSIDFNHRIDIIAENYKMSRNQLVKPSENILFDVKYEDFHDLKNTKFPNSIKMTAQKGYEKYELTMNCTNIDIDGSGTILFTIPDSYEKVVLN